MSGAHGSNAFPPVYSVNIFYKGDHTFTSDTFTSRDQAEDFSRLLHMKRRGYECNAVSNLQVFSRGSPEYNDHLVCVVRCHIRQINLIKMILILVGMTLEAYKRGYLLRPSR